MIRALFWAAPQCDAWSPATYHGCEWEAGVDPPYFPVPPVPSVCSPCSHIGCIAVRVKVWRVGDCDEFSQAAGFCGNTGSWKEQRETGEMIDP